MSERQALDERTQWMPQEDLGTRCRLSAADHPASVVLPIHQIKLYDRNPRREPNPQYALLKESICLRGLNQPLVVTQRPGDPAYTVKAGGNTRLAILKELFEETHEERFYWIRCEFKPWVSESDTLTAHLIENEQRGNLVLIDRARALRDLKGLFEQEIGISLSLRAFAKRLQEVGYYQHPTVIGKMDYALDFLWPAIPEILKMGIGRKTVEAIRRLHVAAERLWTTHHAEGDFSAVFQELLRRHDGENWDLDSVRAAVEYEIAFHTDVRTSTVTLLLDELLGADSHGPEEIPEQSAPILSSACDQLPPVVILGPHKPLRSTASTGRADPQRQRAAPRLATLRRRAWRLATRIARRNAMPDLIQVCSTGCGFIVTDTPALPPDPAQRERISALWWQLIACAEMRAAPAEAVLLQLPPTSTVARALAAGDQCLEVLAHAGVVMDPGQCGAILCGTAGDEDWADWMHLMDVHRQLRKAAQSSGAPLWS